MENINSNLNKNAYPPFLIDTVIKKYLDHKFSINQNQLKDTSYNLSHHIKNKVSELCKEFCKENFNIKLVYNSFKIKGYFSYKDPIIVVILKLGFRNISKRITSLIFLNMCTPPQHALNRIILVLLK